MIREEKDHEEYVKLVTQMGSICFGHNNMNIMEACLCIFRSCAKKSGMTPESRNSAVIAILNLLDNTPLEQIHIKDRMNEH